MKAFADKDFLLNSETAKTLYHDHAASMPIIDYHCHVNPKEIAEDRRFANLAQVWLGGDHYKWRLIRANGEDEKLVTGTESGDYEKFMAFVRALPKAIGNPVYHWAHLELQRYFDCDLPLTPDTADEIWELCNKRLTDADMSVRGLITQSRVEVIATTDDPADSLEWHKAIAEDKSFNTKVLPTLRPDKAINIDKPGFAEYIRGLEKIAGIPVKTLDDLFAVFENRLDFFAGMGCLVSDHGLDYVPYADNAEAAAPAILEKAMNGTGLSALEAEQYKTAMLLFLGRQYAKRGWVMQYHYGAQRNLNTAMFKKLGPDTGYDAISSYECGGKIAAMLNLLAQTDELPKTILYSLNPNDDAMLATIAGCFPGGGIAAKVQHGSAWWFNDTKPGMEAQIINLANKGLLGCFVGMLTDSRSFLSYTRHEYFRRILCNVIGSWVENGEYPNDIKTLGEMVKDISYNNTVKYFGF
ncbi:MAG: glucuronate isomerase [Defluviitaleaceae bacterium]|nr:glucuronate isomerase [Defluviitaleaceae bacterium]